MGFESRAFPPADGLFLGVESSATGRAWRDRLDARGAARALAIAQRYDLPELLARIIAARNIEIDAVEVFLDPTVRRSMPDPHVLTAMPEAAARIADAVQGGETIAIFGDYDVDGATSSALLARFLRQAGSDPLIHIPDRLFEGYGPNVEAVRGLANGAPRFWLLSIAARPVSSRWRRPAHLASTSSSSIITKPTKNCRRRWRSSIRTDATISPGSGISRLSVVTFMTVVAVNRAAARARLLHGEPARA